ncbi:MAG: hypothetical protein AMS21_08630 [Gemmatimonas sp. SG8_38_2]|nr:MAG: hypothetical protein AMS21_08630 [Gemmatimonas sp. SG8_38_2]
MVGCAMALLALGCANEAQEWESAQEARSVEAVQAFLERFGDGEKAAEARSLIELVQEEQSQWEAASAAGTDQALRRYIEQYPQSRFFSEATVALEAAVARLIEDYEPEFLAIVIEPGLAVWRGPLAFALGDGRQLTWGYTFIPPDPLEQNVVVAVLDDRGLIPSMQKGHAYIWRGGTDVIDWRSFPDTDDDAEVAGVLGFDPTNAYISATPSELSAPPSDLSPEGTL